MKIALMHFHLKTGGVCTVIRQQISCLKEWADILVITGEPAPSDFPIETIHIPGIAYDRIIKENYDPLTIARAIDKAIRLKWRDGCDILHVHNPLLAKNRSYLKILKLLQSMDVRLFLQIHDFAEDGRPDVYYFEKYPDRCCYGVINSRDYDIMQKTGVDEKGLFKLFNMVNKINILPSSASITKHILYPVRALRRKNIGEAILLSLFFQRKARLAITLPPYSPTDLIAYNGWKDFVAQHGLNVTFEMGLKHDFTALMGSAEFILTTSITEGFGFCFLEPWVAGKYLCGRLLPEICRDFKVSGVCLDHLYKKLAVPVEWIDEKNFFTKWSTALGAAAQRFNHLLSPKEIFKQFERIISNNTIDFGLLDEFFQKSIIQQVLTDSLAAKTLLELNPYLARMGIPKDSETLIENNCKAILKSYSRTAYSQLLRRIYQKAVIHRSNFQINKKTLLTSFLTPNNTSLLKWSAYAHC
jgi:glycosyltransferase involved in cell wall biosynthesis